ncbi:MAG: hypothetical protein E6J41_16830 [Chloroflexi bacterium]|nr:MAG: hypothetical protein E6J41_16830 [Chloroflexota bacterium]
MRHLSDGALRRLYDEPYSLDEETRAHYNDCADCQARFATVADDARHTMGLLAVPAATVDPAGALARVKARNGTGSSAPRLTLVRGGGRRLMLGGLAAAVLAGAMVATLAFTPLAANLVKIFQPTQVTVVPVQASDFQGLSAFSNWGDVKGTSQGQLQQAETAAEAARIAGLPAIQVDSSTLPASLRKAPVSYGAVTQSSGTVTFNDNAPAKLRGSTLTLVAGPAEATLYGDLGRLAQGAMNAQGGAQGGAQGSADGTGSTSASGGDTGAGPSDADRQSIQQALSQVGPILAVAEMKSPQVSSTGASVADIKSALLAQPGLSPTLRSAISSIDSPSGNLPIPIPSGYVNSHNVKVQGVTGTAFGDNTGLGSAVVWIKGGKVYAVAGTVTEDQVLAVANGVR